MILDVLEATLRLFVRLRVAGVILAIVLLVAVVAFVRAAVLRAVRALRRGDKEA